MSELCEIDVGFELTDRGRAVLVTPEALADLDWGYVLVDDRAGRALVRIRGSDGQDGSLEEHSGVRVLSEEQADDLRASYPTPKLKRKEAWAAGNDGGDAFGAAAAPTSNPEGQGARKQDPDDTSSGSSPRSKSVTMQTVRWTFHLIDVPVEDDDEFDAG